MCLSFLFLCSSGMIGFTYRDTVLVLCSFRSLPFNQPQKLKSLKSESCRVHMNVLLLLSSSAHVVNSLRGIIVYTIFCQVETQFGHMLAFVALASSAQWCPQHWCQHDRFHFGEVIRTLSGHHGISCRWSQGSLSFVF